MREEIMLLKWKNNKKGQKNGQDWRKNYVKKR